MGNPILMRAPIIVLLLSTAGCDVLTSLLGSSGECEGDDDCHGSKICVDNECVECENDRDCDADHVCDDGECVRDSGVEGEGVEGEGVEGEGVEGEGDVGGEGEGEGEGNSEAAIVQSACQHIADCGAGALQTCVDNSTQELEASAGVGQFLCDEMHDAFLALLACDRTASCADITAGTDCQTELAQANTVGDQGALSCLAGNPPVTVPAAWDCPGRFFGVGDGCDCGCGAIDDDCNGGGCSTVGCSEAVCEFCYASEADAQTGTSTTCASGEGEGEGAGEGEGEGQ